MYNKYIFLLVLLCSSLFSSDNLLKFDYSESTTLVVNDNITVETSSVKDMYSLTTDLNKTMRINDNIAIKYIVSKGLFTLNISKNNVKIPMFIRIMNSYKVNIVNDYYYNNYSKLLNLGSYTIYIKYDNTEINKTLNITKDTLGLHLNIIKKNKNPIFVRLSNIDNINLINAYQYGNVEQYLKEGFYTLYIKENGNEIFKNILIKGKHKGISKNFDIKSVNMLRDIPYNKDNKLLFQWYPYRYSSIKAKYLIQFKDKDKISSYITQDTFFEHKSFKENYKYRVFSYPSVIYDGDNISKIMNIFNLKKYKWKYININAEPDYLFGQDKAKSGNIDKLSLMLPSGIAFTEDKSEYIISSADAGTIIYVKDNKYKRYVFRDKKGIPLKLGSPIYKKNGKFILTENRNSNIVQFDINTKKLTLLAGNKDGKYEDDKFKKSLDFKDKLGIFNNMLESSGHTYLTMALKYKETPDAWYGIPIGKSKVYEVTDSNILSLDIDFKEKITSLYKMDSSLIIRTSIYLIKLDLNHKIVWKYKLSGFGAGLSFVDNEKYLIFGNHTALTMLDVSTGKEIALKSEVKFANIVDIRKIGINEFAIVDSDSGSIYFGNILNNTFVVNKYISSQSQQTPNLVAISKYTDKIFVATSNPSYIFSFDIKTKNVKFIVGNGKNKYASLGKDGLDSALFYPKSILITKKTIYIPESNNRIVQVDRKTNKISLFAGTIYHNKANGKHKCNTALFANVRSIIKDNDNFIISDSGNNRIVSMQKIDNLCTISEIKVRDKGKLNYPTYLFINKDKNYFIEQNANVIYQFDTKGILDTIGSRRSVVYQGMGKDNDISIKKENAYFSTPTDLCFNSDVNWGDFYNGFI